MIYTITFNPSIDYVVRLDNFSLSSINRVNFEETICGGKGINVSIVLKNFGHATTAKGFVAGFTGTEICHQLDELGVKHSFVTLPKGFSRINVKIQCGNETAINGQGPNIPEKYIDEFFHHLDKDLVEGDIIVIAGSIPNSLPQDIYEKLLSNVPDGVKIVVDAEKDLLMNCLKFKPFLVKPNNYELGAMFGVSIKRNDTEKILSYAKKLQELGAQNVLVSLAGSGAVLIDEYSKLHQAKPPKGKVLNSVGAGDSMVAGFIAGYIESEGDYFTSFKWSIAAGAATAFSDHLVTREEMEKILNQIK